MRILAIETSCDETAAALVEKTDDGLIRVLSEAVASSEQIHVKTGGIVPEVASREQLKSMVPVIEEVLLAASGLSTKQDINSNMKIQKWAQENVDAIAVTMGPGLIGSLLVGVETAKSLALAWNKPLIPVNHLVAHFYANWIEKNEEKVRRNDVPEFPAVGLTVSGGHTELVLIKNHPLAGSISSEQAKIELLGSTRDDAAGECLDKCARVMGLSYPGGPAVSAAAEKFQSLNSKFQIKLPRPLQHDDSLDFSFSGLKIAVLKEINKKTSGKQLATAESQIPELAYELQEAVVDSLVGKLMRAVELYKPKSVLLAGGVSANSRLREELKFRITNDSERATPLFVPELKYCTDNAVMVGAAAVYNYSPVAVEEVKANPALEIV